MAGSLESTMQQLQVRGKKFNVELKLSSVEDNVSFCLLL